MNPQNPVEPDLTEPLQFLSVLRELGIRLVNITAGSPYSNPHIQRPALFPPSDGYQPPEDPLIGVARQMAVTRALKQRFPEMLFVGTAYSYLQEFLPYVGQAAVREGWVDSVGLGRITLSYPELARDVLEGRPLDRKRFCRTFSDCTTGPRNGAAFGLLSARRTLQEVGSGPATRARLKLQAMNIDRILQRVQPGRTVHGIAAALLPFESDGRIAVDAFQQHLQTTHRAGLTNAVNMDTGYVNYLSAEERQRVLAWAREALGPGTPFVAGAYIEDDGRRCCGGCTGAKWIASRTLARRRSSFKQAAGCARPLPIVESAGASPLCWRSNSVRSSRPTERSSMRRRSVN